jgi:hypothetical protein
MANGQEPVTKADLESTKDALRSDIDSAKGELRRDIEVSVKASEDRVIEAMRDIQTELLKAFYTFTTSQQQRLSQVEGSESAMVARLGTLEARVLDLERKVNFPNHPAQ